MKFARCFDFVQQNTFLLLLILITLCVITLRDLNRLVILNKVNHVSLVVSSVKPVTNVERC